MSKHGNTSGQSGKKKGRRAAAPNIKSAQHARGADEFDMAGAMTALERANHKGDRAEAKKLRRQLRAHGHTGGLRNPI